MHTLQDSGLGLRCFLGFGEADFERRERLYLSRERDLDVLLPLLLLVLLALLDDRERDREALLALEGVLTEGDEALLEEAPDSAGRRLLRVALPRLEALLLWEELPEELERLEPDELEREPELERLELLLLPNEELQY